MKILLVDDHLLFLEGMQNLLSAQNFAIVGTAHNGYEAIQEARRLKPDVILMDIQMPELDGLQATRLIKEEMPAVQIVMLTMSAQDEDLFEAIKCGATGYLLKNLDADQFFDLLSGLERGEAPMTRELSTRVLAEFTQQMRQKPSQPPSSEETHGLTERQLQVLKLMAQGYSNQEVADTLFITERTVKYHVQEILQKLHLRNRAQAIAYAVHVDLIKGEMIDSFTGN